MDKIFTPKTLDEHRAETVKIINQLVVEVDRRNRYVTMKDTYRGLRHEDRTEHDGDVVDQLLKWKSRLC